MTDILDLTKVELVEQSFDCCIQAVKSFGSPDLANHHRDGLITCMEHFKALAKRDIEAAMKANKDRRLA